MYKLKVLFVFLFFGIQSNAQVTWQKVFDIVGQGYPYHFAQTSDSGYIVTGDCNGTSAINTFLMKTNGEGDVQWSRSFGSQYSIDGYAVCETADGGFAVCGDQTDIPVILKTDASGNLLWVKTFFYNQMSGALFSVLATEDSGLIAVGGIHVSLGQPGGMFVVKTDISGNIQWAKKIGTTNAAAFSIKETADHGFIISGETNNLELSLVRIENNGNVWMKSYRDSTFASNISGTNSSVEQAMDGGYIIATSVLIYPAMQSEVLLLKTDSTGNPLWCYSYGTQDSESPFHVEQTTDSGFIVSGVTGP
jgi:hypothetical protein